MVGDGHHDTAAGVPVVAVRALAVVQDEAGTPEGTARLEPGYTSATGRSCVSEFDGDAARDRGAMLTRDVLVELLQRLDVPEDGLLSHGAGLGEGVPLSDAARQCRHGDDVAAFLGGLEDNGVGETAGANGHTA